MIGERETKIQVIRVMIIEIEIIAVIKMKIKLEIENSPNLPSRKFIFCQQNRKKSVINFHKIFFKFYSQKAHYNTIISYFSLLSSSFYFLLLTISKFYAFHMYVRKIFTFMHLNKS